MPAPEPVYFLRSELQADPEVNMGYRWSLHVVKVSDTVGGAYLAFTTMALAERFLRWQPKVGIVCSTELEPSHACDFSSRPVVLFETEAQVDACVANRAGFAYEALIAKYSTDAGLTRSAGYQVTQPHAPDTAEAVQLAGVLAGLLAHLRAPRSRDQVAAIGVSAAFILLSLLDGWLKIHLMRGPLIGIWIFDLTKWLLLPMMLMFILHRISSLRARDYGLVADLGLMDILALLPVPLTVLFALNFLSGSLADAVLQYPAPPFSNINVLSPLGPLWLAGALYFSVSAGLWESLFFIALPWIWFAGRKADDGLPMAGFNILSATLFAACHWENGLPNALGAFAFQLGAVWWYFRLKTLWPVIGAHALIDLYYFWPSASPAGAG